MLDKKKTIKPIYKPGVIRDEVKDFSNDSFIIKKNEKTKEMVERVGFSKKFLEK